NFSVTIDGKPWDLTSASACATVDWAGCDDSTPVTGCQSCDLTTVVITPNDTTPCDVPRPTSGMAHVIVTVKASATDQYGVQLMEDKTVEFDIVPAPTDAGAP